MADRVTSSNELKLVAGFYDGDTRAMTIDDPKGDLTATQIKAVGTTLKNTAAIIGDKAGAAFTGFVSAKKSQKTTTQLDLTL